MDSLHRTLIPGGLVHIATDYLDYFKEIYTLLNKDERFTKAPALELPEEERTDFELLFTKQGMEIGRCSFIRKHDSDILG
jgi:tRNA G46 methylase TrmB